MGRRKGQTYRKRKVKVKTKHKTTTLKGKREYAREWARRKYDIPRSRQRKK